jgi:hypothetical protein
LLLRRVRLLLSGIGLLLRRVRLLLRRVLLRILPLGVLTLRVLTLRILLLRIPRLIRVLGRRLVALLGTTEGEPEREAHAELGGSVLREKLASTIDEGEGHRFYSLCEEMPEEPARADVIRQSGYDQIAQKVRALWSARRARSCDAIARRRVAAGSRAASAVMRMRIAPPRRAFADRTYLYDSVTYVFARRFLPGLALGA